MELGDIIVFGQLETIWCLSRNEAADYLNLGTPPRLGHSNEHHVAAAIVQLTSSNSVYFRTFQRFQVYALFFVCLRA